MTPPSPAPSSPAHPTTHPITHPRFALGLDVGGTKIEALLLDPQGRERWREHRDEQRR